MPPMKFSKDGRKAKDPKKTLLRLLGYMKHYIPNLLAVLVCIVVAAIASTRGSENIGNLVDDYILPMVESGSKDFAPLVKYLLGIAAVFGCGMLASFLQQFLMVTGMDTVHLRVRTHHRSGFPLLNRDLKTGQIQFPQRPLIHNRV